MSTHERKVSLGTKNRPTKTESRAEERPQRARVSGRRDILSVENQDPDYEYYFAKDTLTEVVGQDGNITVRPGQRIMELQAGGWQFVSKDEVKVGESQVYDTANLGSIVRIPAGMNEYLYLMKKRKDWVEEDREYNREQIRESERQLQGYTNEPGSYGSLKIE